MAEMKLLITGSRSYPDPGVIPIMIYGAWATLTAKGEKLTVMHGAAPDGVDWFVHDYLAKWFEELDGVWGLSEDPNPADWDGPCDFESGLCQPGHRRVRRFGSSPDYCPTAGFRRNQLMVDKKPDAWWAFTDRPLAESKGTADCVKRCKAAGISGNAMELWRP